MSTIHGKVVVITKESGVTHEDLGMKWKINKTGWWNVDVCHFLWIPEQ